MFGWNILKTKRTVGGLFGYSSVNCEVSLKVPEDKEYNTLKNAIQWLPKKGTKHKHASYLQCKEN
jgi:hypothetical protein